MYNTCVLDINYAARYTVASRRGLRVYCLPYELELLLFLNSALPLSQLYLHISNEIIYTVPCNVTITKSYNIHATAVCALSA